ncbi:hypothetical protein ABZU75_31615 [Streptosporangium sp. NPDC005286]|uniref:hypothetical protein n=1 Tax=Streptosporangium sp. NPDC005286 TaxID=3154463 RepID=UPI00339E5E9F
METLETLPLERGDPFEPPAVLKELHGPPHPMTYADGRPGWLVTGYTEARAVLDDPRFSNTSHPSVTQSRPGPCRRTASSTSPRPGCISTEHTTLEGCER